MVEEQVRIFNAYKSASCDRQIGDKRGRNSVEAQVAGPSSSLPAGVDLQDIFINPYLQCIFVSITDRKDYYHQLQVTESKACSNSVGPPVPIAEVVKTRAYTNFLERSRQKYKREKQGDRFSLAVDRKHLVPCHLPADSIWVSFNSVLQGDHAGVEVATESHISLLQSFGLLGAESRLVANRPLRTSSSCQGLVIDDFFALSVESRDCKREDSNAHKVFVKSQRAYKSAGLLGSPSKDVDAETSGKLIGAFVNAAPSTLDRGLCTVGAPPAKRIALSHLTFEICKLSHTTDCLHLCVLGAWVSILCYRRPLMSLLNHSFRLVDMDAYNPDRPQLIPLPRKVACELAMVASLCVFAVFDLAAEYDPKLYCTDASSQKGAIVSTPAGRRIVEILWKSMRSKGAYTRLLSPAECVLKNLGELEPSPEEKVPSIERPLAYHFDFVEIYAGASLISDCLNAKGFVCGPPIELSRSPQYDMQEVWIIEWLTFLVSEKRLKAFFLCPPCTTFSIMRRPALRSKTSPFGFRPDEEKTKVGNTLAHRALQLMYVGAQNKVGGIIENPWSSFMKLLPAWQHVLSLRCAQCVRADSCRFGSPHQKGFRFMSVHIPIANLARRCVCKTKHLQVQGVYTKGSAVYTPALANEIASCIGRAIVKLKAELSAENSLDVKGLEAQICNDIVMSSKWSKESCWTFRKKSHINILEMASVLRLVQRASDVCRAQRLVCLVDSHVTKGATSKGRTASLGLGSVLRRLNAHCVASSIYLCIPFCPTRLNPSDDPTRDREIREALKGLDLNDWSTDALFDLAALPRTSRWASGWVRLVLRLLGQKALYLHRRDLYRQSWISENRFPSEKAAPGLLDLSHFNSTLGYPGEGWFSLVSFWFSLAYGFRSACCTFVAFAVLPCLAVWVRGRWVAARWLLLCFLVPPRAMAMPIFPQTVGERLKADARRLQGPIPMGRPVLPKTGSNREKLLHSFLGWAGDEGIDFSWMLDHHYECIDEINLVLSRYGRLAYDAGKSYNSYAELLNAVTSWKPSIRRLLQGAWDLGYSWKSLEPGEHHVAMPPQILLAMVTTSLLWGWVSFAGCISLGFAGLLRPGELLASTREELLLPSDVGNTTSFALLSIREPKSRFTNARHQSAKIDIPDLLRVCELAFSKLAPGQRLWPHSGQTFRNRFKTVLTALSLPMTPSNGIRALDPGSLRAGSHLHHPDD